VKRNVPDVSMKSAINGIFSCSEYGVAGSKCERLPIGLSEGTIGRDKFEF